MMSKIFIKAKLYMTTFCITGNQREELEAWVGGVESGCEFVEKALTHCPAMEVVLVRKQLGERLMDYANMNVPPAPRENSHLK